MNPFLMQFDADKFYGAEKRDEIVLAPNNVQIRYEIVQKNRRHCDGEN